MIVYTKFIIILNLSSIIVVVWRKCGMKDSKPSIWVVFTALLMMPTIVLGQIAECSAVVQAALNATDEVCKDTGRNQACYGHIRLEAEPQSPDATFEFNSEGDTVDLAQLGSLRLSPMNVETNTWGVALMKLQADIPNENPANVSLLVFGDVELKNAIPDPILVDVTIKGPSNANVRRQPSNRAFVLGTLTPGTTVSASGRSEDGSWIYVVMPDGSNGWLRRSLVNSDDSLTELREINPSLVSYGPMQAFYIKNGDQSSACSDAPNDGILIQTPEGVAEVRLWINEVKIRLGSTAFIQTTDGHMQVTTIEGTAHVEALGVEQVAVAGSSVSIQTNEEQKPIAPPSQPVSYVSTPVNAQNVQVLEREITIAPPLEPSATLVSTATASATVEVRASATSSATAAPVETEAVIPPTAVPTNTALPTNTNVPPTAIIPTDTSVPPSPIPTNTSVPPPTDTAAPPPAATNTDAPPPPPTSVPDTGNGGGGTSVEASPTP